MQLQERMKSKKEMVVGYLGGSITEGAGASGDETTYRSLVTRWLAEQYPENTVTQINAGIGGTGSDLGVFRADKDLLAHKPDIVFLEFAVNDYSLGEDMALRSMEGIVRKILRQNPDTLICFLYTLTKTMMEEDYSKGKMPKSVQYQERLALHYQIPTINVGFALHQHLTVNGLPVADYLPDNVHPNDAGYRFYADVIGRKLSAMDFHIQYPSPLCENPLVGGMLLPAAELDAPGWVKTDELMQNRMKGYIYSDKPGDSFTVSFTGSVVGLYWTIEKDSGNIRFSIDGGAEETASSWDKYALQFNRACYKMLATSLPAGKHTLRVTVAEEKEEQSEGRFIRIGAVLCEKDGVDA